MKNITVKEFIEYLGNMNPDAIVCNWEHDTDDNGDPTCYSSIEVCKELSNVSYIDDVGNDVIGDIVVIA